MAAAGSGDAVLVGDDAPKTTGIPPYPLQGLLAPIPTPKSPLLPLFLPSQDSGGRRRAGIFLTRDRGDFLPAAQGKTFGLEEQGDPGAEQRQTALTTHGVCRMLSLASLKSLKLGNGACSSHTCQEQPQPVALGTA